MQIRAEHADDFDAIYQVTRVAFEPMFFSDGTEATLVGELRRDGDLTISLVAEVDGRVVGHIAFSPATIDGFHNGWFGLGPVSVLPDLQRRGIGRALVEKGLERLRALDATGCVLTGNPDIYSRMGFQSHEGLTYGSLESKFVQWIAFKDQTPVGTLRFAPAFGDEYPTD